MKSDHTNGASSNYSMDVDSLKNDLTVLHISQKKNDDKKKNEKINEELKLYTSEDPIIKGNK